MFDLVWVFTRLSSLERTKVMPVLSHEMAKNADNEIKKISRFRKINDKM